jgi:hypothetical protein
VITTQTRRTYFDISSSVPASFVFDFWYYIATEFFAVITLADGTEVPLINGTDYTLTAPAEGGTLTRVTDWETLYPTAISLTLYRLTPRTQQTNFANGSKADAEVHEATHDYAIAMLQEAYDDSTRAPLHPITDPDGLSYAIPTVALRSLQYLSWDADGNIIASPGTAEAGTADAALLNGRASGHGDETIPVSDDAINGHLYAGRAVLADEATNADNAILAAGVDLANGSPGTSGNWVLDNSSPFVPSKGLYMLTMQDLNLALDINDGAFWQNGNVSLSGGLFLFDGVNYRLRVMGAYTVYVAYRKLA